MTEERLKEIVFWAETERNAVAEIIDELVLEVYRCRKMIAELSNPVQTMDAEEDF